MINKKDLNFKILNIDVSKKHFWIEKTESSVFLTLLGGKGLGAWLLLNKLEAGISPLDPKNILIFVTGPLTGTYAPTSSRFGVITKSPKTNAFLDSYCGGFFGQAIKYLGYDAIVILGSASDLTLIKIDTNGVDFVVANNMQTMTTFESDDYLKETLGNEWQWVIIGPAGERCSPLAGIFSKGRCAGRGGAGAVMGSKKIKAIAIKEQGFIQIAKPKEFMDDCKKAYRAIRMSSSVRKLNKEGTAQLVEPLTRMGGIGTNNFQSAYPELGKNLFPEELWKDLWIKSGSCFACPIACSKYFEQKLKKITRVVEGPDFETIFALGINCGIYDKHAIAKGNAICDEYGIDTISTGGIIAFLMELNQRGYLKSDFIKNLKLEWGSADAMLTLVKMIGEGKLSDLEKGVSNLSEKYPGSEDFAMHVKGMEFPAYHPWKAPGIGLAYAVSDRGACHLRGTPIAELLGFGFESKPEDEAEIVLIHQDLMSAMDCLIVCVFVQYGIGLDYLSKIVEACIGKDIGGSSGLELIGRRSWYLSKLFNIREGIEPHQDTLPKRCLQGDGNKPLDLEKMKQAYYKLMGYTTDGYPTLKTLKKLNLDLILDLKKTSIKIWE